MSRKSRERMELMPHSKMMMQRHGVAPTGGKVTGAPGDAHFHSAEGRTVAPHRRHMDYAPKPTSQVAPRDSPVSTL